MAQDTVRFFCTCGGQTSQLHFRGWLSVNRDFERTFGRRVQLGERFVKDGGLIAFGTCSACGQAHPAERRIYYAAQPSHHNCNSLCMEARGPNCECKCGGRNHGAGFIESGLLFAGVA